jgi:hypothetical protein
MKASGPRRIAAFAVSTATLALAVTAQAAAPAYPPYPTGRTLPEIAAWLRAQTTVDLGAVVGVGADSVFALEPTREAAQPPTIRATVRQEIINPAFAASLGGRSAVMVADIDCEGHRVFQRALDLYAGNNRQGAVRHLGAAADWQAVPPGTFMDDVVAAVCEPDYHPIFPAGQVAAAAAAPTPGPLAALTPGRRSPATSLQPVRPAGPAIPLIAPAARAPVPAPAPAAPTPAPVQPQPAPVPAPAPRRPAPPAVAMAPVSPDGPIATQPAVRPPVIAPSTPPGPPPPQAVARAAPAIPAPVPAPPAPPPAAPAPAPAPAAPVAVARAPAPRPAPRPVASAPAPRQAPAATARPPAAAPRPAPRPAAPSATALGLRPLVLGRAEIGAFATVDAAIAAWRAVAAAYPAAMAGKRQRIDLSTGGGVTRFHAFVDGFAGRGEAEAFCRMLAAQGQACRPGD